MGLWGTSNKITSDSVNNLSKPVLVFDAIELITYHGYSYQESLDSTLDLLKLYPPSDIENYE